MRSLHFCSSPLRRTVRICLFVLPLLLTVWFTLDAATDVFIIIAGASVICFLADPLARIFERRFSRNIAVLFSLASCFGLLILFLCLLLPSFISQSKQLIHTVPESFSLLKKWISGMGQWVQRILPGFEITSLQLPSHRIPDLAKNTFRFAGNLADLIYRLSLMIVLSYFLMCDKEKLLLLIELLIPSSARKTAVRMGNAVCRELYTYIRSQGIISMIVGLLTAVGLAAAGLESAIVLGLIVGILNMIPYFGPLIGAVPAVLTSLGSGFQATIMTIAILWLVQQIDGTLISPRIMSNQTGISPAIVLLAIFAGSEIAGIIGMLFAMPVVMSIRTVFRVFVQRYENV